MSVSLALLILRVVVGLFLVGHGSQKLFGWFGGHGLKGTTAWIGSQGFKPAWFWALLAALGEFGGGLLLVLGFLTPIGALAIYAAMLVAIIKVHGHNGFWGTNGGYEYPLILLILSLVLGLVGPGSYSIDALLGYVVETPLVFWGGLVIATIVVAIGLATSRQAALEQRTA